MLVNDVQMVAGGKERKQWCGGCGAVLLAWLPLWATRISLSTPTCASTTVNMSNLESESYQFSGMLFDADIIQRLCFN